MIKSTQLNKFLLLIQFPPQAYQGLRIPNPLTKPMTVFDTFFAFSFVSTIAVTLLATALAYQPDFR